jgi:hypothetical protein
MEGLSSAAFTQVGGTKRKCCSAKRNHVKGIYTVQGVRVSVYPSVCTYLYTMASGIVALVKGPRFFYA